MIRPASAGVRGRAPPRPGRPSAGRGRGRPDPGAGRGPAAFHLPGPGSGSGAPPPCARAPLAPARGGGPDLSRLVLGPCRAPSGAAHHGRLPHDPAGGLERFYQGGTQLLHYSVPSTPARHLSRDGSTVQLIHICPRQRKRTVHDIECVISDCLLCVGHEVPQTLVTPPPTTPQLTYLYSWILPGCRLTDDGYLMSKPRDSACHLPCGRFTPAATRIHSFDY